MGGPAITAPPISPACIESEHPNSRPERRVEGMRFKKLNQATDYDPEKYVAEEFLEGSQSNVRIIRLGPGVALPPHKHGSSDLMLYAVEGTATLDTPEGDVTFEAGTMVFIASHEELRVSNQGATGVTLLAFLTPMFPPR